MDEDLAQMLRKMTADLAAQQFIIDHLMQFAWVQMSRPQRLQIAKQLLDKSEQTEHLRGIAANDELMAANLADVAVRMQESVDHFVGRALKSIGDTEDGAAIRRYQEDRRH